MKGFGHTCDFRSIDVVALTAVYLEIFPKPRIKELTASRCSRRCLPKKAFTWLKS